MSYQATGWACAQRAGSAPLKAVLMVLAEHSDKSGLSWPSTRTIAEEAECDQRTARRHVEALRDRGLLTIRAGAGKASNRYQLAMADSVVRHPDASLGEDVVRHPDASTTDASLGRSEASEKSSEASSPIREAVVRHDESVTCDDASRTNYLEQKDLEPTTTARGRSRERAREAVTPAELNATAHTPRADLIVRAWGENRGLLGPQRRDLMAAVDTLLGQGADPARIPAALDEAHDNAEWKNPARSLRFAYERVTRQAQQADRPLAVVNGGSLPPGTSTLRSNAILALRTGDPR